MNFQHTPQVAYGTTFPGQITANYGTTNPGPSGVPGIFSSSADGERMYNGFTDDHGDRAEFTPVVLNMEVLVTDDEDLAEKLLSDNFNLNIKNEIIPKSSSLLIMEGTVCALFQTKNYMVLIPADPAYVNQLCKYINTQENDHYRCNLVIPASDIFVHRTFDRVIQNLTTILKSRTWVPIAVGGVQNVRINEYMAKFTNNPSFSHTAGIFQDPIGTPLFSYNNTEGIDNTVPFAVFPFKPLEYEGREEQFDE